MQSRDRTIVLGLIAIYLLIAIAWQGLSLYDDSLYLRLGQLFRLTDLWRAPSYAPLYALWIHLVFLLFHDPVACYMANWALLVALAASITHWMRLPYAWAYTLVLVALPIFSIGPYVSLFASVLVVCGIGLVLKRALSLSQAIVIAGVVCFLVALVRPEFEYALYLCLPAALIAIPLDRAKPPSRAIAAQLFILLALAGAAYLLMHHAPTQRSGIAFAQHYNWRAAQKGLLTRQESFTSNYAQRAFGIDPNGNANDTSASLGDFLRANPRLFLGHVLDNLCDLRTVIPLLGILLLTALPWCLARYRALRPPAVYLLLVSIPVMASMVIIYPRAHYPVVIFPAALIFALQLLALHRPEASPPSPWLILPLGAACIAVAAVTHQDHRFEIDTNERRSVRIVRCIQATEHAVGPGNGRLYDTATVFFDDVYFPTPLTRINPPAPPSWSTFTPWIASTKPSWIILSPWIPPTYRQSPEAMHHLLENQLGYVPHDCPATGDTIYTLPTPSSRENPNDPHQHPRHQPL
jgi:hypothetical protein